MKLKQALELVREKCLEEQKDIISGKNTDKYKRACIDYPALMIIAHHLWAIELAGNNNELSISSHSRNEKESRAA